MSLKKRQHKNAQRKMTNLESVKALIGLNYPFDDETFTAGLALAGLDPNGTYEPGRASDVAFADFILFLTASARRISEGGYTVEIDTNALFRLRAILLNKWGIASGEGATLRNKTYLW